MGERGGVRRPALPVIRAVGLVVGLLGVVVGTFLPWLGSGTAERNSYEAGGAVRTIVAPTRPLRDLLAVWPLLGLAAAVAVATLLLGRWVLALLLALVVAGIAGGGAAAVLSIHDSRYARVLASGPVVSLCGATLVALTALIIAGTALARRIR